MPCLGFCPGPCSHPTCTSQVAKCVYSTTSHLWGPSAHRPSKNMKDKRGFRPLPSHHRGRHLVLTRRIPKPPNRKPPEGHDEPHIKEGVEIQCKIDYYYHLNSL